MKVEYRLSIDGVDWDALTAVLVSDDFSNGRTPEELRRSFANSQMVCFAWADGQVVGKGRLLSDGVCNAYLVDLWTLTEYRRQGIARSIVDRLTAGVSGQHIYLQADDDLVSFYEHWASTLTPTAWPGCKGPG